MNIVYTNYPKESVSQELLTSCAELFSNHYGVWGPLSKLCGKRISLSGIRLLNDYLYSDNCGLVTATVIGRPTIIVGHSFYSLIRGRSRFSHSKYKITWITQLVVHRDYRNHGISKNLLYHSKNHDTVGLGMVTSNPFAIKSLEAVMGQRYDISQILEVAIQIVRSCGIRYLKDAEIYLDLETQTSLIDTRFYIDHTEALENLEAVSSLSLCRDLPEGHEFFVLILE